MREFVHVREVGLRDGLQMVSTVLSTEQKLDWCRRELAAGVTEMEVTSFVPPRLMPQFADAAEVAAGALLLPGLHAAVLVPNLKGAQRAFDIGVRKVDFVLSASDDHNQKNVRRSTAESVEDFGRIIAARDEQNLALTHVGAGVATAFGCTIAGDVAPSRVLRLVEQLLQLGADEITIADTVGYADPAQVRSLMRAVLKLTGNTPVTCHFHDTRGLGLANVYAALDVGVRSFDASLAGLGGCPFAPNASGNINTEDCVYLLESMGFDTGIDIDALLALRQHVEPWLPDEPFVGAIKRAGLPKTFAQKTSATHPAH